jgi:endoglucanase
MVWAAAWMYKASGQAFYLSDAEWYYPQHLRAEADSVDLLLFNWDNVYWGANVLLADLTGTHAFHAAAQKFLKYWVCGTSSNPVEYTPDGRAWNVHGGQLGTTANAVFLSNLYGMNIRCGLCGHCPPPPGHARARDLGLRMWWCHVRNHARCS